MLRKINTGLGKDLEFDVPLGKPEEAIRQEPLETNKLRDAFAAKGRLREDIYVSSVKVKNEPDKFVVFDLKRNPQDGKSRAGIVVVAENMEQLYEKLSQKAFPRGRTRLIYEEDAAANPAPSVNTPATGGGNRVSARQQARKNRQNRGNN
jgi:benzoyl-CoA reductase/2-hydroxyglutaryl-CoA dehydratase subunit BcrC/BadD/HgdB